MASPILLASQNRDKRAEVLRALGLPDGQLLCPDEVERTAAAPDPIENADTYLGNAIIKAREFSAWASLPALADDSGLEVDALNGQPGVFSARYAGPNATYTDNCDKMIAALAEVEKSARTARFRTVIAVCVGDECVFHTEGVCEGLIIEAPRGEHGFGYDPIFVPAGEDRTFAEMSPQEKDHISHRGRALAQLSAAVREGSFPLDLDLSS